MKLNSRTVKDDTGMFVLDTDHLGVLQRREEPVRTRLLARLDDQDRERIFLSIVSFHENAIGWNAFLSRAKLPAELLRGYSMLERILLDYSTMNVFPFDSEAIGHFELLRRERLRVGTMDLRIAAICLANGFTLLSRNLNDFRQIPGLRVEDWTKPA